MLTEDDAVAITATGVSVAPVSPLDKLPNIQVFEKDPEQYTEQDIAEVIDRLSKTLARFRKARQDAQEIAELAAKLKATNTKAAKNKAKKTSTQIFEEVVNGSTNE